MNRAKAVSINRKARVIKTALDFHAASDPDSAGKKQSMQTGNFRTSMEQELDLVVGRSIN